MKRLAAFLPSILTPSWACLRAQGVRMVFGFSALLCATSCVTEGSEPDTPYSGASMSVALSVGSATASGTRMSSAVVQKEGEAFRGISSLVLVPFTTGSVSGPTDDALMADCGPLLMGAIARGALYEGSRSHLFDLPSAQLYGTRSFLAYASVNTAAEESTVAQRLRYGALTATALNPDDDGAGHPSAIGFSLVPLYNPATPNVVATALAYVLTQLAQVTYSGSRATESGTYEQKTVYGTGNDTTEYFPSQANVYFQSPGVTYSSYTYYTRQTASNTYKVTFRTEDWSVYDGKVTTEPSTGANGFTTSYNAWTWQGKDATVYYRTSSLSSWQNKTAKLGYFTRTKYVEKQEDDTSRPIYTQDDYADAPWSAVADGRPVKRLFRLLTSLQLCTSDAVEALLTDIYRQLLTDDGTDYSADEPRDERDTYTTDNLHSQILATFTRLGREGYLTLNEEARTVSLAASYRGYPQSLGLPAGAAYVNYNQFTRTFTPGIGAVTTASYQDDDVQQAALVSPAALYYRANSPIQVTPEEEVKPYYESSTSWADDGGVLSHYTAGDRIVGSTRSVALAEPLQYAVARLDIMVQLDSRTLRDSRNDAKTIPVAGLPVKAVLIGGQQPVAWDFRPTSKAGANAQTIYAPLSAEETVSVTDASPTPPISTLALETWPKDPVWIALELENNTGTDFYGHKDDEAASGVLIPAGACFYLIAELNPETLSEEQDRKQPVLRQDRTTTVSLRIGSLSEAYAGLPDLRAAGLQVGLRIDTDWQSGISKEHTVF